MSRAKLHSRLEALFEGLEKEGDNAPAQQPRPASGWTWECDAGGNYRACSPEVAEILGIEPEQFLGNALDSYGLEGSSSDQLKARLAAGIFPLETNLLYQGKRSLVPVVLHIFEPQDPSGESGLRGFTQVVQDVTIIPEMALQADPDQPKQGLSASVQAVLETVEVAQPEHERPDQTQAELIQPEPSHPVPDLTQVEAPSVPVYSLVQEMLPPAAADRISVLSVPVQLQAQARGLLEIVDDDPERAWTEDERRLVEQVADQLSLALENARLFQAEQQRANELDRLVELSRLISQNLDLEDVFSTAQRIIGQLMPAEAFFINLYDRTTKEFISSYGVDRSIRLPVEHFSAESGFSGSILKSGRPLFIQDLHTENVTYPRKPAPGSSQWVSSLIAVPLRFSGEIIGTLSTQSYQAYAFKDHDLKLLETFADHIAIAIQNARLFEQTQRTLAETEILYQASAELNAVQDFNEILTILCKSTILGHHSVPHVAINSYRTPWVGHAPPASFETIASWSLIPGYHTPTAQSGSPHWERVSQRLRPDQISVLCRENDPELLEDAIKVFGLVDIQVQCILLAPLNVGGNWSGFVYAGFTQTPGFSEQDFRRLMALANQAAIAIQNLHLLEETKRRASQLETAAEIARHTSATLALDNLLKRAVTMICDRYGYYHASIYLVDAEQKQAVLLASTGEAGQKMLEWKFQLPIEQSSVIGSVTKTGKMLVINNVTRDPLYRRNPLLPQTRAELGIPLKIGTRVIGALDVHSDKVDGFIPEDTSILQTLADQITVAVDNARSYEIAQKAIEESRQRVQELSVLFNTSQALASAKMESQEIANIIARRFLEVFRLPKCSILLIDPESQELYAVHSLARGTNGTYLEKYPTEKEHERAPINDFPEVQQVIRNLAPLSIKISERNIHPATLNYLQGTGSRLMILLPLAVKGQAIGLITLEAGDEQESFKRNKIALAVTLANAAAAALENARLYEIQLSTSEKLREVDKLKSQFLANMSHELRTPLNSIIGFSKVILKGIDGPVTEMQGQDLKAIYSAGQHLLNLINDILDISKIEAGKMELSFVDEVNLADLISSVLSTAVGLIKDKPIQLKQIVPPDLPTVRADPTRLRQVILNLVSNAAKFTEQGSITIEAGVETPQPGQAEIMVKVIDTGIGISPVHQTNLFQPFTQVDGSPTRKTGGSGLGLSISRLLVEIHGGRIGVESSEGQGSCFYFTLPIEKKSELPQISAGKRVILAIEGEWQVLYLYDRYLSEDNYVVIPVIDPAEAITRAQEIQPYAIILDIMIPEGKGWKTLEDLKKNPATSKIPIIICSLLDERKRAYGMGAEDYLLKPILGEDLMRSIRGLERKSDQHAQIS